MSTPRTGALVLMLMVFSGWGCNRKPAQDAPGWTETDGGIRCEGLQHLACTGLYGEGGMGWATKTVPADVRPFEPGLPLWSDGLEKSRFIFLPPGTRVDSTRMDEWRFPPGTKLWKEFSWKGRRIETRFLWKRPDNTWLRTTYRWSDDERTALEFTDGEQHVPGTNDYEIPSQADCQACHGGRGDGVLGFEAVALAHSGARGLTLERLVQKGLLTHAPGTPPRIPGTPVDAEALGYLHMNCGVSCHNANPTALGSTSGLHLRLEVAELGSVAETDTWRTAVGVKSLFRTSGLFGGDFFRVAPGDVKHSTLLHRVAQRGSAAQMPPLATHVVDERGHALLQRWIEAMPPMRADR
ncbi:hypothetical protein [Pyxidicoccus sp. MSG2]|uniref:hypothetical protein n=1 Tax=Pyxidicoccus sp. MSG2 TaxID=2996790 RepID=UPI00227098A6|nr:hypothetical protein [Pyxidicoccus sp. MSG2]MCY1021284.1 hypothetical protein [Pyxidicoccus sp. MSG2]